MQGPVVYNLDKETVLYKEDIGAIGILSMLYDSPLLVYVGAGEQPQLSPRTLSVINCSQRGGVIAEKFCDSGILNILLNMKWMVIVLEDCVRILNLKTLNEVQKIQTPPNIQGVAALSSTDLLALPSSNEKGIIRVHNLNQGANLLCEIRAHNHMLSALSWNPDGSLLASASEHGTVIRVFKMPNPEKSSFTLRVGLYPTKIYQLAFSPSEIMPPIICAATSRGEVALFRLIDGARKRVKGLSSWIPFLVHDIMDVDLPWLILKVPREEQRLPAACGIYIDKEQQRGFGTDEGYLEYELYDEKYKEPINVAVATARGEMHVYRIDDVRSTRSPTVERRSRPFLEGALET
eukprot:TRINITY_DN26152_c0_g1_i2.p1 TRINITY_DN26152_c0_g1~~TRINITY_DN26152_c0_g1_i2.p1  ORF type:complete len:386 (-),score=42.47 TRINITY_DN26152_c0_g1_i2:603-1649(-)